MDLLLLEFNLPPFSINSYYYRTRQRTKEARLWANDIFRTLANYKEDILEFRSNFDVTQHSLGLELVFTYPQNIFYTKQNTISSKTMDITNVEKPILDLLTHPRYNERPLPEGCLNLNIDDKFITEMHSTKQAGKEYSIKAIFYIIKRYTEQYE